eukprot:691659-Hanusia_phi.AAC.1
MTVSRNHWPWAELSPPAGLGSAPQMAGSNCQTSVVAGGAAALPISNAPPGAARYGGPAARPGPGGGAGRTLCRQ